MIPKLSSLVQIAPLTAIKSSQVPPKYSTNGVNIHIKPNYPKHYLQVEKLLRFIQRVKEIVMYIVCSMKETLIEGSEKSVRPGRIWKLKGAKVKCSAKLLCNLADKGIQ